MKNRLISPESEGIVKSIADFGSPFVFSVARKNVRVKDYVPENTGH